jgi:hypothetical protein
MTQPVKAAASEAVADPDDLSIDAVLARFGGDPRDALEAALIDIRRLERELVMASLAASYGYARGRYRVQGNGDKVAPA